MAEHDCSLLMCGLLFGIPILAICVGAALWWRAWRRLTARCDSSLENIAAVMSELRQKCQERPPALGDDGKPLH